MVAAVKVSQGGDGLCGCICGVVVSKGNINGRWGVLSGSGDGGGGGKYFWGSGEFSRVVAVDDKYC